MRPAWDRFFSLLYLLRKEQPLAADSYEKSAVPRDWNSLTDVKVRAKIETLVN